MFMIVTRQNINGTFDTVGMNNRFSTSHYKTVRGLLRYGISDHWRKSGFKIEVYRDRYAQNPVATQYYEGY